MDGWTYITTYWAVFAAKKLFQLRLRCDDVESSRCLTDSLYGDECESHGGQSSKHGDPDCGGEGLQEREQGPGGALMI